MEKHSEQSRKPLSQQWILKKAEKRLYHCYIVNDRLLNLFKHFLLVILLPGMICYQCLCTKNYKAVYTYRQVFCSPESISTKLENQWFTAWTLHSVLICTGYWESGTLLTFFYYELLIKQVNPVEHLLFVHFDWWLESVLILKLPCCVVVTTFLLGAYPHKHTRLWGDQ